MPEFYHNPPSSEANKQPADGDPVRTFLTWVVPSRPYRAKDHSYFTTSAIILVLLILISILFREYILVGVFLAFAFVIYVLAFVPPEDVEIKISTQGVTIGDHFYFWDDLDSFWFSKKEGFDILNVTTNLRFPGRLMILVKTENLEEVKKVVAKYLPFHEIPPKSLMEDFAESLQKHFPLENSNQVK